MRDGKDEGQHVVGRIANASRKVFQTMGLWCQISKGNNPSDSSRMRAQLDIITYANHDQSQKSLMA
nr:CBM_HP1_G0018140.mRNA.1.CDS.1 [Saccharomyces cerevisiae]